jgi:hypothetical protein
MPTKLTPLPLPEETRIERLRLIEVERRTSKVSDAELVVLVVLTYRVVGTNHTVTQYTKFTRRALWIHRSIFAALIRENEVPPESFDVDEAVEFYRTLIGRIAIGRLRVDRWQGRATWSIRDLKPEPKKKRGGS